MTLPQVYDHDDAVAYAKRRTAETGKRYMVSSLGHVLPDAPHNRRMIESIGADVCYTTRNPKR